VSCFGLTQSLDAVKEKEEKRRGEERSEVVMKGGRVRDVKDRGRGTGNGQRYVKQDLEVINVSYRIEAKQRRGE
jgi:hypothetical protein